MSEYNLQVSVMDWANVYALRFPELKLLHASMNGMYTGSVITATKAVKSGLKKGVPDLFLPVPRGGYHGLFIELKWKKGRLTKEQKEWLSSLANQGYATGVWRELNEIVVHVENYLNGQPTGLLESSQASRQVQAK